MATDNRSAGDTPSLSLLACVAGDQPPEGATPPIFEYPNPDEGCSVTGGVVYRGEAIELRRRDRESPTPFRGFRLPGYPWTLILFLLAAAYVVIGSIRSNPGNALRGALLLLAGIPVCALWRRRKLG